MLLLNPDTVFRRGAIDRLVARLDARPDVAMAGPRIVDGEGRAELSFGSMIAPLTELRQKVLVRRQRPRRAADRVDGRSHDASNARRWIGSAAPAC